MIERLLPKRKVTQFFLQMVRLWIRLIFSGNLFHNQIPLAENSLSPALTFFLPSSHVLHLICVLRQLFFLYILPPPYPSTLLWSYFFLRWFLHSLIPFKHLETNCLGMGRVRLRCARGEGFGSPDSEYTPLL